MTDKSQKTALIIGATGSRWRSCSRQPRLEEHSQDERVLLGGEATLDKQAALIVEAQEDCERAAEIAINPQVDVPYKLALELGHVRRICRDNDALGQQVTQLVVNNKEFRAHVDAHDWSMYQEAYVALQCSSDAIIPGWAFMLVASKLQPYAKKVVQGNLETLETALGDSLETQC